MLILIGVCYVSMINVNTCHNLLTIKDVLWEKYISIYIYIQKRKTILINHIYNGALSSLLRASTYAFF